MKKAPTTYIAEALSDGTPTGTRKTNRLVFCPENGVFGGIKYRIKYRINHPEIQQIRPQ